LAASSVLAVFVWRSWPGGEDHAGLVLVVGSRTFADVLERHWSCVRNRGSSHHDESLPYDPELIARKLGKELGLAVLVPDFSPQGFRLVGVDRCGIGGRPGSHALYRSTEKDIALSVFSVGRLADLGPDKEDEEQGSECYVSADGSTSVIAWHHGKETHFMCADLPQGTILNLARMVRTANIALYGLEIGPWMLAAVALE
jgi:anti-sigma factor RsiW